jgi:NAD-dependent dihydropyrimidine dehydrogenase PreA subunit
VALFIDVLVDPATGADPELARRLVEVCPVDIFARGADGRLAIVEKNLDECTLCELCLSVGPPGAVQVRKLYDGGRPLERSA